MKLKETLYIFHIEQPNGDPILLHPFYGDKDIIEKLPHADVMGLYGGDPRVETITLLRNILYRKVETAVQNWLKEKRFLRKFLISSFLFLFVYLLMSIVIRDPIPMIDESLIGLAVAIAVYIYQTKRERNSEPAIRKRVQLRSKIDAIRFSHHPFLGEIEKYVNENPSMQKEQIFEYIQKHEYKDKDEYIVNLLKEYVKREMGSRKIKKR